LFSQGFTPKESLKYQPKQLTGTHQLLRRFLRAPDDFMNHFRQYGVSPLFHPEND
jgi:hypothetical protein